MTVKGQLGCMRGLIARDELLDAIDSLHSKISQCLGAGMSAGEIQSEFDSYLKHHCEHLRSVTVKQRSS